jgi:hypothetical protein
MGIKKERRLAPPLRVEVSELRLRKTADLPRPSQLRSVLSALPLGSDRGPSTPALFIDVFRPSRLCRLAPAPPSASRARTRSALGSAPACAFASPRTFPRRSAFRSVDPTPAEAVSCRLASRGSRRLPPGPVEAFASWRLSPGIAFPFRVALFGTTGALQSPAWATCSVPREHSFPLSSALLLPSGGSAVRPVGFV